MAKIFEYYVFRQKDGGGEEEEEISPIDTSIPFDDYLKQCWTAAMDSGKVFRYTLEGATTTRLLDGQYGFIVQNNPKRLTHKRIPVDNRKLTEPFSEQEFNFNKITNGEEILCHIRRTSGKTAEDHLIIANISPIEVCHSLLVPRPKDCLPQVITEDSLLLCLELFSLSQKNDFIVVANSLLAYASVNHLHYHFLCLDYPLLAYRLDGLPLTGRGCYELKGHPMYGFGFQCIKGRSNLEQTASDVYGVVKILLEQDIPHNMFILRRTSFEDKSIDNVITVLLVPRKPAFGVKTVYDERKDVPPLFVAACEIGGFVPIIDEAKYSTITENEIVQQMKDKSLTSEEFQSLKSKIITS